MGTMEEDTLMSVEITLPIPDIKILMQYFLEKGKCLPVHEYGYLLQ